MIVKAGSPQQVPPTWRRRVFRELDVRARPSGLSSTNRSLALLIIVAVTVAVLETESSIALQFVIAFSATELALGAVFLIEYVLRFWIAAEGVAPQEKAWRARLRFVLSPAGLADAIAIIASFASFGGSSALVLRLIRLGRMFRLAKLGRMSRALDHMVEAIGSRRDELVLSLVAGLVLLLFAATALYLAEGAIQPDKFGSIPRALWWAVATMTTIGYGDVYPITPLGKLLASLVALISIGLVAMPTGILAAAFSDAMQRHKDTRSS